MSNIKIFKAKGFIVPKKLIPNIEKIISDNEYELAGEYIIDPYNKEFMLCELSSEKTILKSKSADYYGNINCNVVVLKEIKKPKVIFDQWKDILEMDEVIFAKFICMII